MKKIYLAGPDVFASNSREIANTMKSLCAEYGFIGLYPADNECKSSSGIFNANMRLLNSADFVVANMSPFRGPSADAGTIFEIGVALGIGTPVAAYSNTKLQYIHRVDINRYDDERGEWLDVNEKSVENFGHKDNLMLHYGVSVWRDNFRECLEWCRNEI